MQAGISEPVENQRLAPVAPLFPHSADFAPELVSVGHFCQLQLNALLHQLTVASIQFFYFCWETQQRQVLSCCSELWIDISSQPQLPLSLEQGWQRASRPNDFYKVASIEQKHFYCCPLPSYCCPLPSAGPAEYLLIGVEQDLTELQRTAIVTIAHLLRHYLDTVRELQRQRQQVQHWQRAIHQAQHQLRTPIALSQLYADVLVKQTQTVESRAHLCQIQDAIQDIKLHVDQLAQNSPYAPVLNLGYHDLHTIVTNSLRGLLPWLDAKNLTVQHPGTSVILEVDAWQIKQVFDNLFTNAIHYSPDASTIGCSWQVFQREILVELWDEGPGLSEQDLQQVFAPYYSRRPGGTGLGLAIAQTIVEAHCGRLWANNRLPGGAKFSFTIPRRYSKH